MDLLTTNPVRRNILLTALVMWGAALVPIIARGRRRWTAKCIIVTIMLPPIGWFVTLLSGLLVLSRPDDSISPREMVEDRVSSEPVQLAFWATIVLLTAFTIVGGIVTLVVLAVGYGILLWLLPGPDYGRSAYSVSLSAAESSASGVSYLSGGSDDRDDGDYEIGGEDDGRDDDEEEEDDDDDRGSLWDGWLFKS